MYYELRAKDKAHRLARYSSTGILIDFLSKMVMKLREKQSYGRFKTWVYEEGEFVYRFKLIRKRKVFHYYFL